jgi:hypothetical protein
MDLGHLVDDRDRLADADEPAVALEVGDKVAQIDERRLVAAHSNVSFKIPDSGISAAIMPRANVRLESIPRLRRGNQAAAGWPN